MESETYKKIEFHEDGRQLFVVFKWFTPMAFFLLFFCIAWDTFLVFWYSMAGQASVLFLIFPIAHVAVGVGLTYYTACLFFNKTFIVVDDKTLKIKHAPLPWTGNMEIDAADIEQLYVKEKTINNKNGTSHVYELRGVLKNQDDVTLVSEKQLGLSSDAGKARMLERKIEMFLGIRDFSVEGEYGADEKSKIQERRTSRKNLNPTDIALNDLKMNYVLSYGDKTWVTVHRVQYDWKNGETDILCGFTNVSRDSMLLYLQNRMGVCHVWIERKVDLFRLETAGLTEHDFESLPSRVDFEGTEYLKQEINQGMRFVEDSRQGAEAEQCFFASADKTASLRIVRLFEHSLAAFAGQKANEHEFGDILPGQS
jgi:hypothetical protein